MISMSSLRLSVSAKGCILPRHARTVAPHRSASSGSRSGRGARSPNSNAGYASLTRRVSRGQNSRIATLLNHTNPPTTASYRLRLTAEGAAWVAAPGAADAAGAVDAAGDQV